MYDNYISIKLGEKLKKPTVLEASILPPHLHYLPDFFPIALSTFRYHLDFCNELGSNKVRLCLNTLASQLLALTGISCVRKEE